jgi:hypothetical protein
MEIQTAKEEKAVIVSVQGRIDAVTAPEFEKALSSLIARGENVFLCRPEKHSVYRETVEAKRWEYPFLRA